MAKRQGEPKNVAAAVTQAIAGAVTEAGFELWDVEYVKEGSERYLRITVDRPEGVDMNACEQAMRIIDPIVTELDPIEEQYHLEVSSPGLERSLRTERHFEACVGSEIRVRLFTAVNGSKEWTGTLTGCHDGLLTLKTGSQELTFERKCVSKANVVFDFDAACAEAAALPEEAFVPEEEKGDETDGGGNE